MIYEKLTSILGDQGGVEIARDWYPNASRLPWSCNIYVEPCGYGTGNTMLEAIEDALADLGGADEQPAA